jgi:hypothetical protein
MPVTIIPQKAQAIRRAAHRGTCHDRSLVAAAEPEDDCCSRSGAGPTQKSPAERSVGDEAGLASQLPGAARRSADGDDSRLELDPTVDSVEAGADHTS